MPGWPTGMKVLVGGLLTIIVVNIVLLSLGYGDTAALIGNFGTLVWMVSVILWIVFFDSKKRWPSKKPFDRFASLITSDPSREAK